MPRRSLRPRLIQAGPLDTAMPSGRVAPTAQPLVTAMRSLPWNWRGDPEALATELRRGSSCGLDCPKLGLRRMLRGRPRDDSEGCLDFGLLVAAVALLESFSSSRWLRHSSQSMSFCDCLPCLFFRLKSGMLEVTSVTSTTRIVGTCSRASSPACSNIRDCLSASRAA